MANQQSNVNLIPREVASEYLAKTTNTQIKMISITDRLAKGKAAELAAIAEKAKYGKEYDPKTLNENLGHNVVVETILRMANVEAIRMLTDNFKNVATQGVCVNTDGGYARIKVEDFYDDMIVIDCKNAYVSRVQEDHKKAISRLIERGLVVTFIKKGEKVPLWYFQDPKGRYISFDIFTAKKKSFESVVQSALKYNTGKVLTNKMLNEIDMEEGSAKTYFFLNASPSSMRGKSGIFIKAYPGTKLFDQVKKAICLSSNDLVKEFEEDFADGILFKDAAKFLSRPSLPLTNGVEYQIALDAFCYFNAKYQVADIVDGKPVALADGSFHLLTDVVNKIYKEKFGCDMPPRLKKQFVGYCSQMRIGGQDKGEATFLTKKLIAQLIDRIMSGGLSFGEKGRVILIHNDAERRLYKKQMQPYDIVFSGNAYDDIKADDGLVVTDPEKIAILKERCQAVTDKNAQKYARILIKPQSLILMAFPPMFKRSKSTINLSNQICMSLFWNYKAEDGKYHNAGGVKVFQKKFKKNLYDLARSFRNKDYFKAEQFSNFDSYADDAIKAINAYSYLIDPYGRNQAMRDLLEKVSNMINNFSIEVAGFNAVGVPDLCLLLTGYRLLEKNEIYSGNVQGEGFQEVAIFRHPKVDTGEYGIYNDLGRVTMIKRLADLYYHHRISKELYIELLCAIKGIHGRMAMLPTFDRRFAALHGGSDLDGDSFAIITDAEIVAVLKGAEHIAIEYGDFKGPDEKVVFSYNENRPGVASLKRMNCAFHDNDNIEIGTVARFNGTMVDLRHASEMFNLEASYIKALYRFIVESNSEELLEKHPEIKVFESGKKGYKSFFDSRVKDSSVLIDAKAVDEFKKHCCDSSIYNIDEFHDFLRDMSKVDSSLAGRIIDAAKTIEEVFAPFVELFTRVKGGFAKGIAGVTDVKIGYYAQHIENGKVMANDFFKVETFIGKGIVTVGDTKYFVIDSTSRRLKNWAARYFCRYANKCLRLLDKITNKLSTSLTYRVIYRTSDLLDEFKGARNVGRIYSGLNSNRRDVLNDIAPYVSDTIRLYGLGSKSAQVLKLALAASRTGNIEKDSPDLLKFEYTKMYSKLGAERAKVALFDRLVAEGKDVANDTYYIKDKVYVTSENIILEDEQEFTFEKGIAKVDGGCVICSSIDGTYKITVEENGKAYIITDIRAFIREKEQYTGKIIVNLMPHKNFIGKDFSKNDAIVETVDHATKIIYDKDYVASHVFVSKVLFDKNGYRIPLLFAINNETKDVDIIGRIAVESLKVNYNKEKDCFVGDRQYSMIHNRRWNIDNIVSYQAGRVVYAAACMSYIGRYNNVDKEIAQNVLEKYNG